MPSTKTHSLLNFDRSITIENDLEGVLKLIATRETQGLRRRTFFVSAIGGWNDHFYLGEGYEWRMERMSRGIAKFQGNLEYLGLADSVIGFSASEFSRTLQSTGAGSDHAWDGPQMVFGKPIKAGKIFDLFPSQELNGPDDAGRGGHLLAEQLIAGGLRGGALFVFTNKRRNRFKALYYDLTGVCVLAKRLEEGTFAWPDPSKPDQQQITLTPEALHLLFDGVDLRGPKLRPWYERDEINLKYLVKWQRTCFT